MKAFAILLASASTEATRTLRGTTRGMTPCELRKWHVDIDSNRPGCSNSWKVPSSWHFPANEVRMFYASSEHCCADLFGGEKECHLSDFCECEAEEEESCVAKTIHEQVDPLDKHCEGANGPKWHFDLDTKRGCTNSPRFPDVWKDPDTALDMFFDTPEACCEKFTRRGDPCTSHDVCQYKTKARSGTRDMTTQKRAREDEMVQPDNDENIFSHSVWLQQNAYQ